MNWKFKEKCKWRTRLLGKDFHSAISAIYWSETRLQCGFLATGVLDLGVRCAEATIYRGAMAGPVNAAQPHHNQNMLQCACVIGWNSREVDDSRKHDL